MRNVKKHANNTPATKTLKTQNVKFKTQTQTRPFTDGLQLGGIFFMQICKFFILSTTQRDTYVRRAYVQCVAKYAENEWNEITMFY